MGLKYCEMNFVRHTATGGKQDNVILRQINEASFQEVKGQLEITVGKNKPRISTYPMEQWDDTIKAYEGKGFYVVPGRVAPPQRKVLKAEPMGSSEPTKEAQELINLLTALANQTVAESFSFSFSDLTKEQVDGAKSIFTKLATDYKKMTVDEFNKELCHFFSIVPRRMRRPNDHMVRGRNEKGFALSQEEIQEEMAKKLQKETELFETMQELLKGEEMKRKGESYSQKYDLSIKTPTAEEVGFINRHLGQQAARYIRSWKVEIGQRERLFKEFCEKNNLSDENRGIAHLFHGTRSENLLSIICSGLLCAPKNTLTGETPIITGKAYGLGIYFAKDAIKSAGYMSATGSKWTQGNNSVGYMFLNKVAVGLPGTQFNGDRSRIKGGGGSSLNWDILQKTQPGAFATWAECRYSGYRMDEIIVYQDAQTTPEYLIELAA